MLEIDDTVIVSHKGRLRFGTLIAIRREGFFKKEFGFVYIDNYFGDIVKVNIEKIVK